MNKSKCVKTRLGLRSEIQYFDDNMNPISRDRATWALVRNLDENRNLLFEAE